MTAKEYLHQVRKIEVQIRHRREQIAELKEKALATGSLALRDDIVQTSKTRSRLEDQVVEYADMELQIAELTCDLERQKARLIDEIHQLTDQRYIDVLYLYYVQGMRLTTVAKKMRYSYGRTTHLIREAERAFEKVSKL